MSFIEKIKPNQLRKIGITISGLGLFVTLYDFWISQIFMAESIAVIFLCSLFTANILRLTMEKYRSKIWLCVLFNLTIVIVNFLSSLVILLVFWGYGFMGSRIPLFPVIAIITCIASGLWAYLEMIIMSLKNKENIL